MAGSKAGILPITKLNNHGKPLLWFVMRLLAITALVHISVFSHSMPGPFISKNSYNCKDGEDKMVILASCMDLVVQVSGEVNMLMKGANMCSLDSGAKVW